MGISSLASNAIFNNSLNNFPSVQPFIKALDTSILLSLRLRLIVKASFLALNRWVIYCMHKVSCYTHIKLPSIMLNLSTWFCLKCLLQNTSFWLRIFLSLLKVKLWKNLKVSAFYRQTNFLIKFTNKYSCFFERKTLNFWQSLKFRDSKWMLKINAKLIKMLVLSITFICGFQAYIRCKTTNSSWQQSSYIL